MPAGVALPGNTGAHTVQENTNTAEPQRKVLTRKKPQKTPASNTSIPVKWVRALQHYR